MFGILLVLNIAETAILGFAAYYIYMHREAFKYFMGRISKSSNKNSYTTSDADNNISVTRSSPDVCPKCGRPVTANMDFCISCGTKIR